MLSRQGDALFEDGRFIQSAQAFAKSSRSFEYVTLKFVDVDERDALRIYLSDRLDLLDKRVRNSYLGSYEESTVADMVGSNTADDARYLAHRDLPFKVQ